MIAESAVVPKGYKQTEVGVFPEDWDAVTIQSLLDSKALADHLDGNHGELYPRSNEFQAYGIPYVTANDFLDGRVQIDGCKCLSAERAQQFRKGVAKNGDVLFAHNATVGPTALLKTHLDYVILSTTATYFRCNPSIFNNVFFRYALQAPFFVRQYQAVMAQSTRNQVPITTQRKLSVLVPTLAEQEAIATALSDTDGWIESLEGLIAKKRHLKQAAMQQLLTGKKRLPGFDGEWEVKRLEEIGKAVAGLTYTPSDVVGEGGTLVLRASNIAGSTLVFRDNVYVEVDLPDRVLVKSGDILICVRNGSRDLIGKCAKIDAHSEEAGHVFGAFMCVYRTEFHDFVFHQFQSDVIKKQIHEHLGATINQITNKSLNSFEVPLPSPAEQTAIAEVLSDMDAEITAIESKLTKARQIKQGMMQELLTGKTRLV